LEKTAVNPSSTSVWPVPLPGIVYGSGEPLMLRSAYDGISAPEAPDLRADPDSLESVLRRLAAGSVLRDQVEGRLFADDELSVQHLRWLGAAVTAPVQRDNATGQNDREQKCA
jgi:hypothetical protein